MCLLQLFELSSSVKGINGTIFAYGQTSSGKTFTMLGAEGQPGLIRYGINEIFHLVEQVDLSKKLTIATTSSVLSSEGSIFQCDISLFDSINKEGIMLVTEY